MNLYQIIKEASVTDYIDSDALYDIFKNNPVTNHLELVKCYDDMTIKMKGDSGYRFFKVVKTPDGFEAYEIEESGEKIGDTFQLISNIADSTTVKESSLRGSIYTSIISQIEEACNLEKDQEEVQKFITSLIKYLNEMMFDYGFSDTLGD